MLRAGKEVTKESQEPQKVALELSVEASERVPGIRIQGGPCCPAILQGGGARLTQDYCVPSSLQVRKTEQPWW